MKRSPLVAQCLKGGEIPYCKMPITEDDVYKVKKAIWKKSGGAEGFFMERTLELNSSLQFSRNTFIKNIEGRWENRQKKRKCGDA